MELWYLLVEGEEDRSDTHEVFSKKGVGAWLVPRVGRNRIDGGVGRTRTASNSSQVGRNANDLSLENLIWLEAWVGSVVGVLLESEDDSLVDLQALIVRLKVIDVACEVAGEICRRLSWRSSHESWKEDTSWVLHLFFSNDNYYNL